MKIKINGFKSLIKAVQNRAHLFPVKVLVNGKTKTYYSIRYKTGNKAMDIAKKQMKIPDNVEALFDTIDGKKKNLTENDVLKIYSKAGKPGSLQDFIKKNFKKPYVKPRNSTTVDLEQQQMSIDDLMQGDNKRARKKGESLVEWAERRAKEDKGKEIYGNPRDNKYVPYKSKVTKEQLDEAKDFFKDKNTKIYPYDKGVRDDEELFSNKEVNDASNLRAQMIIEYNGYIESIKNHVDDKYKNPDTTVLEYKEFRNTREVLLDREQVSYWNEARNEGVNALHKLESFDERYMAKKRLEEKRVKRDKNKADLDKYISYYKKENHELDIENLKPIQSNNNQEKETANKERLSLAFKYNNEIGYMRNNVDSSTNVESLKNDYNRHVKLEDIFNNRTDADYWLGARNNIHELSDLLEYDTEYNKKEQKPEKERIAFRNVGMDGGLINFIKMREGTTRVESKGEYKQVKNINEFVNQVKPLKDSHTKIKGRAIMDMFGVGADLYVKAGNRPFPLGNGAIGYCNKQYDPKTDQSSIVEIGLVADTGNVVLETETAIHECMHAKLKHSIHKVIDDYPVKNKKRKETIRHDIEETIVEMAGQGVSNLIHGNATGKEMWSYRGIIAQVAPMIWGTPEFAEARKKGLHGIGQEICKKLINNDTSFVQNVVDEYFESQIDNELNGKIENRMQTIEWAITGNDNKVEKIQNDTGKSEIANLVEELKKGTISLEGALNSSKYREIAAILITKFLEDEDLDILEGAANEIKYGNVDGAEMMATGRIPF